MLPALDVDAYERNLRAVIDRCRALGARVVLLTTPAKPDIPLVVNEVPVAADGATRYVVQDAWLGGLLEDAGFDHLVDDPAYEALLREAATRQPELPLPVFRMMELARLRGDSLQTRELDASWRSLDHERRTLRAYMNRVRGLDDAPDVDVVDLEQELQAVGDEAAIAALYLDFVHLDLEGQKVVAQAVATAIARRLMAARDRS